MGTHERRKSRRVAGWLFVAFLVILIVTVRLVEDIGLERKPSDRFIVRKVMDGDTVELSGGDRLRLISIDTPEKGEFFFDEARQFLADVTLGKSGVIEFAHRRRDRYGRLLGYLYVDTIFVNKVILENGLGYLYLFKDANVDRPETRQLLAAQRRAIEKKIGIWSIPREEEEYYIAKDGSFRFHRPGCRVLGELREGRYRKLATREEGLLMGLSPCRTCKP